jgi:hypothetical protein
MKDGRTLANLPITAVLVTLKSSTNSKQQRQDKQEQSIEP